MKPNRRNFIKTLAFGIIATEVSTALPLDVFGKTDPYADGIEIQKGYKVFNPETQKIMEAFADDLVPGAKKIGIKGLIMDHLAKNPGVAGYLDAAFWNLNTISQSNFKKPYYALTKKEDKKKVISNIVINNSSFFLNFRETIIKLYYSNPMVWKQLSYSGPPQPIGFMDYSQPPKAK